jgi:hypothetical protein
MKLTTKINTRIKLISVLDNMKKVFEFQKDYDLVKEVRLLTEKVMSKNIKDFINMEYVKEGEKKI